MIRTFIYFFSTALCLLGPLNGAEIWRNQLRMPEIPSPQPVSSRIEHPGIGVTELHLANGLRILIRPEADTAHDVHVEMFALGGYASLAEEDWASGKISATVGRSSPMGGIDHDSLRDLLCRSGVDFKVKTKLAQRMIEAESDEEGLKLVFKLIYLLFMQTEPTEEALRSVLAAAPDAIGLRDKDPYRFFEDSLLDINTNGDRRLRPLACDDLAKVRLETVKEFFKRCFGNPSDFTLVVVGDVTVERVMDLAQRYLAAIEATQASFREGAPLSLTFPTETLHHYIQLPTEEEDITRVTYPLRLDMSQDRWTELDALTQIVETHLRNRLKEQVGSTCGVDVAYEFPLHPDPSVCWMSIEWRSEAKYTDRIAVLIDEDLETLIKEGVSEADCKGVQQVLHDNDLFWAQDNYFWLAMLSNYAKWHWSMEGLEQRKQAVDKIQCRQLADMLRSQLITKSHTSVTLRHGSATAPALPSGTRGGT